MQAIETRINLEVNLLEKYKRIKLGLMTDLFTGQNRIQGPLLPDAEVVA